MSCKDPSIAYMNEKLVNTASLDYLRGELLKWTEKISTNVMLYKDFKQQIMMAFKDKKKFKTVKAYLIQIKQFDCYILEADNNKVSTKK